MHKSAELEARLKGWADEYAVGFSISYPSRSWLYDAMVFKGPAPQGLNPRSSTERTPADEVEAAVLELERQQIGFRIGRALRAEYWLGDAKEGLKLAALEKIGLKMSRSKYYDYVWMGRVHVAAWLHIPASVILPAVSA